MSDSPFILYIPEIALEKIFSFLSYDEIAKNRLACLSVDNVQKVMILGDSKDFGTCRSVRKNGDPCNAVVNMATCEFCVYHIKQEYQKCSRRSELQSSFAGKGLTALRNKVLGKNEVFYAGKSYMAIPAKRSTKSAEKDDRRLRALNGQITTNTGFVNRAPVGSNKKKAAPKLDVSYKQKARDLELLEKLGGSAAKAGFTAEHSSEVSLESSKLMATSVIAELRAKQQTEQNKKPEPVGNVPVLSGEKNGSIDLSLKITPNLVNRAKLNALKYIAKNGPLNKSNPNSVKSCTTKKRSLDTNVENDSKKAKLDNGFLSDRFKKMMEATSRHTDLLEDRDNEEQEKYFNKLEAKERMEEKMVNTFKVACKAVRCLKCKYTNFSAAQLCKDEKHPLRVFDACKRFFKCVNCSNRTVCLEVVPTVACKNCGLTKWERTGMMKEKIIGVAHTLSIRGGEQKFVNSVATDSNIDLLVPTD